MFKKLSGMFGGGASVDAVLADPNTTPGGVVRGEVRVTGGTQEMAVDRIALELVARVEVESGDSEFNEMIPFGTVVAAERFGLAPGAQHAVPFAISVPWEAPISAVDGQALHGMSLGVRTELELAGSLDKGDLDPVTVHPMPVQGRLLDAFTRLGFGFKGADLERGTLHGSQLPFYQEIEFSPSAQYAHAMNEIEVTFIAGPHQMDVLLELDKRGGLLTSGQDAFNRFTVPYAGAENVDWARWLHEHLTALTHKRGLLH